MKMKFTRRQSLKLSVLGASLSQASTKVFAAPEDYTGRFFVTLQAEGAWDVSSFCDPKTNQPGEKNINNWALDGEVETAGNIPYAPFGNNAAFFQKYYRDLLVINGVDAQTNSHSTGVLHNWSGRNSAGYPSLSALFAAINAPDIPLAYLNFGGYAETARMIRYTRLDEPGALLNVLRPNEAPWDRNSRMRVPSLLEKVQLKQRERLERLRAQENIMPRQRFAMDAYHQARENSKGLEDFANVIPPENELQGRTILSQQTSSNLLGQMQIATLAFKAGVACSADFHLDGFDTHASHDEQHEPLLAHLVDAIDYFWTYAETHNIADRITLLIGSDFSRTPFYNNGNGKDHRPIGSVMVMEKNAAWGNRVIGETDGGQNAKKINPSSLRRDDANGTILYPKHIHKAVRRYLGIDQHALITPFPFNSVEDFNFFAV